MTLVILGGSRFMGRLLVEQLQSDTSLAAHFQHVLICNRGRARWTDSKVGNDTALAEDARAADSTNSSPTHNWGQQQCFSGVTFHHIRIDWNKCTSLRSLRRRIRSLGVHHHHHQQPQQLCVVDFSCTEPQWMIDAIHLLWDPLLRRKKPCQSFRYLLISTDSVYDHQGGSMKRSPDTPALVTEEDPTCHIDVSRCVASRWTHRSVPHDDPRQSADSRGSESSNGTSGCHRSESSSDSSTSLTYGEEKAGVELLLRQFAERVRTEQKNRSSLPPVALDVIILRLPDVIGPFDSTGRFWATMLWISDAIRCAARLEEGSTATVPLPRSLAHRPLSFVYSPDVVRLLETVVKSPPVLQPSSQDTGVTQVYNIASEELVELGTFIGEYISSAVVAQLHAAPSPLVRPVVVVPQWVDDDDPSVDTADYYPSVDCGPLSCAKARRELQWVPTPLAVAVAETVRFFSNPALTSTVEYQAALDKLPCDVAARIQQYADAAAAAYCQ